MERLHFANFHLAGFTYWDGALVFDLLKVGAKLSLEREPDNRYDAKAVAIYFTGHKIGYVPRTDNREISKLCEMGYSHIFDVRINRVSPEEHPENQVGVIVHLLPIKVDGDE